ncbi:MAG TPA: hypothetical protein VKU19_03900 [Bryobacteraceae bacterium]|nr:hypothetical protein [Bryobacteraceae bacterium]
MGTARTSLEISRDVHCLWREPGVSHRYATGVSLHSHTLHSREYLDFVNRFLRRVPLLRPALDRIENRHLQLAGAPPIRFDRLFWRPPLHPRAAHELEAVQIRNLGLRPLVSLTDHDTIEACAELNAIGTAVPYSIEWTIPYQETVFHIGVHNLPADQARDLEAAMAAVTASPSHERIAQLMADLHSREEILVVLNHPFFCEHLTEHARHTQLLLQFLGEFGAWIHALELNGLQPAARNLDTIRLAVERGLPVISGGDRHGCEPNANLNLTNASSFLEFVQEIRVEQRSSVLFLPQYRDPALARVIEFIWHVVRNYDELEGRRRWMDRVYLQLDSGETVACASLWSSAGPPVIRSAISLIGILASPWMRAVLCTAMGRTESLEADAL